MGGADNLTQAAKGVDSGQIYGRGRTGRSGKLLLEGVLEGMLRFLKACAVSGGGLRLFRGSPCFAVLNLFEQIQHIIGAFRDRI